MNRCRYSIRIIVINCLLYQVACISTGCDSGWIPYANNCYMVNTVKNISKSNAQAECNAQDSSLLRIKSQDQLTWLISTLKQYPSSGGYWTDLNDNSRSPSNKLGTGVWKWGLYEPANMTLVKWQSTPRQNCGVLLMTGVFSDRDCTSNANFICFKPQYNYKPTDNIGCGPWLRAGRFCYSFMSSKLQYTWMGARSYCQSRGGDLMKVDSFDKKSWLEGQTLQADNTRDFWTGLNDRQNDGKYVWADGTPVNTSYITWNQEPNDRSGDEDCALIWNTGVYNDVSCLYYHTAAICEIDNIANCPSSPPGWKSFGGNCYLFTPYKNSSYWLSGNEAFAYCATLTSNDKTKVGSLVSVDSKAEKEFILGVVTAINDNPDGWFTSLNDKQLEGYWTFNSGPLQDKSLVDWEGEPSTKPGNDCGMVVSGGNYHEINCNTKLSFICERYATGISAGSRIRGSVVSGVVLMIVFHIF